MVLKGKKGPVDLGRCEDSATRLRDLVVPPQKDVSKKQIKKTKKTKPSIGGRKTWAHQGWLFSGDMTREFG